MIYRFTLTRTAETNAEKIALTAAGFSHGGPGAGNVYTYVLPRDPGGWKDIVSVIRRDPEYHGIFVEFEDRKLDFYCDNGKEFIEAVYETAGIDALIEILIEFSCDGTTYNTYFEGRLNLKTITSGGFSDQEFYSVGIDDAGEVKTVLNRFETNIDLTSSESLDGVAISALTPYDLTLHSKAIVKRSQTEPYENVSELAGGINADAPDYFINFPLFASLEELVSVKLITSLFTRCDGLGCVTAQLIELQEDTDGLDVEFRLKGSVVIEANGLNSFEVDTFRVKIAYGSTSNDNQETLYSTTHAASAGTITVPFDVSGTRSYAGNNGDKFFVWIEIGTAFDSGGPGARAVFLNTDTETFVNFTAETTFPATTAKVFAIHEVCQKVADNITSVADSFKSDYFGRVDLGYADNGCGAFCAITNGFLIRGFPVADRPVRISMKDLFTSLNAIFNLGLGWESDQLVIEPKEYFYEDTLLITLNNVPNIRKTVASRLYFANFEMNYEKWENEQVNGLDEFNTRRQYSTAVKSIETSLQVASKLIGSGYAIEFTRRQPYSEGFTEDWKYDNDKFIICLNRSVDGSNEPDSLDTAEKNENFPYTENVLSPETAYNLRISPARNTLRWSNVLKAAVLKPENDLKFTYGEGNYEMITVQDDECNDYTEGTVFGGELTNDPEFDTGGTWYDGDLNPVTFNDGTGEIDGSATATSAIWTDTILEAGVVYEIEVTVTNLSGSTLQIGEEDQVRIDSIIADGTYTYEYTAVANSRMGVWATLSISTAQLTLFSVKRPLSGPLAENQDIEFAAQLTPIWIPEEYKFKCPITFAQWETIKANPKGYIQFSNSDSNHIKGFILEAKYQRNTGLTEFTLLRKYD